MVIILIKIISTRKGSFHIIETRQRCVLTCSMFLHQARLNASLFLLCQFSGLYIVSFVIIMVGFTLYCAAPAPTAEPTAVPQPGHAGLDNAALKLEETDGESPAMAVQFSGEETVVLSAN